MFAQTTSVSSKGQTVVPAPIRKELGISEGTVLGWEIEDGRLVVTLVAAANAEDPLATFSEWSSAADEAAYADL